MTVTVARSMDLTETPSLGDTVEADDLGAVAPEDVAPAESTEPVSEELAELALVPDDDPIAVVRPGQNDGWAQLVMFGLGCGDATHYDAVAVELVTEMQASAGLLADGVVSGATWALVLPELKFGDRGAAASVLRRLLDLRPVGGFDFRVSEALVAWGYEGETVDRDVWAFLIAAKLDEAL